MDRSTGRAIDGWPAVEQSIAVILTTPIGSRVMRREFGSELPELVDRPMIPQVILAVYAATAQAIAKWEPRFRLVGVDLVDANRAGRLSLVLRGEYENDIVTTQVVI